MTSSLTSRRSRVVLIQTFEFVCLGDVCLKSFEDGGGCDGLACLVHGALVHMSLQGACTTTSLTTSDSTVSSQWHTHLQRRTCYNNNNKTQRNLLEGKISFVFAGRQRQIAAACLGRGHDSTSQIIPSLEVRDPYLTRCVTGPQ